MLTGTFTESPPLSGSRACERGREYYEPVRAVHGPRSERRAGLCKAPRRRQCGTLSRSGNAADAGTPPEPAGPMLRLGQALTPAPDRNDLVLGAKVPAATNERRRRQRRGVETIDVQQLK